MKAAETYCHSCPVRFECLQSALVMREPAHVYGGFLLADRDVIYAHALELHGSYTKYNPDETMLPYIDLAISEALGKTDEVEQAAAT